MPHARRCAAVPPGSAVRTPRLHRTTRGCTPLRRSPTTGLRREQRFCVCSRKHGAGSLTQVLHGIALQFTANVLPCVKTRARTLWSVNCLDEQKSLWPQNLALSGAQRSPRPIAAARFLSLFREDSESRADPRRCQCRSRPAGLGCSRDLGVGRGPSLCPYAGLKHGCSGTRRYEFSLQ